MYSIIVPVYKNADSLPELLTEIDGVAAQLDGPLEVVFVIDGSPDASYALLKEALPLRPWRGRLICHSRNFGSFAATRTGLERASGPYFSRWAADLQEPPELMCDFFRALRQGECDVAVGQRRKRDDPGASRLFSYLYWSFYRRWVVRDIPEGGADAFACNKKVRDALIRLSERNTSLIGLLFWLGFRRKFVPYDRRPRRYGKSAWSFSRKLRYMFDSVYSFTDLPIAVLTFVGAAGVVISVLFSILAFAAWALGMISVAGYTPTVLLISFFGALNMFGLGIIGAYVWRAFENTKMRPQSVVFSDEEFAEAKKELAASS